MKPVAARFLHRGELAGVDGAVVAVDVIRAFTTAAAAFAAGADAIYLVDSIEAALSFVRDHPGVLAMGEDSGRRPPGFDLSNSPVAARRADLSGRTLVQRTSAGTRGAVAATDATRRWAASLVCASATARAVQAAGLGDPAYVLTGWTPDAGAESGEDDRLTAEFIEAVRCGHPVDRSVTADRLRSTRQARRVLLLGADHVDPGDVDLAASVDAYDFAMEIVPDDVGLRLVRQVVER